MRKKSMTISLGIAFLWVLLVPFMQGYFHLDSALPLLAVAPIWIFGILSSVDGGYIKGNLKFGSLAIVSVLEALIRFVVVFILAQNGFGKYVYVALPISSFSTFACVAYLAKKLKKETKVVELEEKNSFPYKFFATTALTKISATVYLTFDVILAKHFLPADQAGQYALLSLAGKMVYFAGSLFSQFILPLVSHDEGKGESSSLVFLKLLFGTFLASFAAFVVIGFLGNYTMPLLFGQKVLPILPLISWYAGAMVAFTVASNIVSYHQIKSQHLLPVVSFILALLQLVLISVFHKDMASIAYVMVFLGFTSLAVALILHLIHDKFMIILNNFLDFLNLFAPSNIKLEEKGTNILIFNWRDTKHLWAGGAEVYIQELAKRWVNNKNSVTLFCGNDGLNPRNQTIDGVNIVRRGGFYTVYFWAFLYYVLKFRGKYDIIVDSENGVPFFSPLFTRKPVVLLIHHVHQEIFMEHLKFPFSYIAKFIEGKFMPFVYKNNQVITVSQSSMEEIVKSKIAKKERVSIINPGIEVHISKGQKSKYPSFIYLGRLKSYKNIDVAIKAFKDVSIKRNEARLSIVGEGESMVGLMKLTKKLGVDSKVNFFGKVTDKKKVELLARSWVALQPSQVEGWGITVLEANASGTPVIASKVNGLKDSIVDKKTGVLVEVRNVKALQEAMVKLIDDTKYREKLTKNAIAWSKKFSWSVSASKFEDIIEMSIANVSKRSFLPNLKLPVFNRN
jgi:glycosyltransferase involved in cell wall biosynthesis/O-antigen/teichoic acid export membrane protein